MAELERSLAAARAAEAEARTALDGVRVEARASAEAHAQLAAEHADLARDRTAAAEHERHLDGRLAQAGERLRALEDELRWRAQEMDAARTEARTAGPVAFGAKLRRRLASWKDLDAAGGLPRDPAPDAEAAEKADGRDLDEGQR